jgi:hypothetical protein
MLAIINAMRQRRRMKINHKERDRNREHCVREKNQPLKRVIF